MNPDPERPRLRPRFKGIENFLRRIAFNLGNTPSQTEVKVISCVPIDVTDLQNRIVELEKQLDAKHPGRAPQCGAVVAPALGVPVFTPKAPSLPLSTPEVYNRIIPTPETSLCTNSDPLAPTAIKTSEDARLKIRDKNNLWRKKPKENIQVVYFAEAYSDAPTSIKRKLKKIEERKRKLARSRDLSRAESQVSRSYVEEVVRRQYAPSLFSWPECHDEPTCRDEPIAMAANPHIEICSYYCNSFYDLDKEPVPGPADYCYYDSKMYDVVPVRDTPCHVIDEEAENVYYRDSGNVVEMIRDRSPSKTQRVTTLKAPPQTVMYATVSPPRSRHKFRYKTKIPMSSKSNVKREQVMKKMQRRRAEPWLRPQGSRTSCVECGKLYAKVVPKESTQKPKLNAALTLAPPAPPPTPRPPVEVKNVGCLAGSVHYSVCQTATRRSVQLGVPSSDSTKSDNEITLNQIKSILRAVLTEVKINSHKVEDKVTKDAIVQNCQSKGNVPTDRRVGDASTDQTNMTSYLYTPYSIDSYSPFMGNPCCKKAGGEGSTSGTVAATTTNGPTKELQQHPLLVQAPARCTCCYHSIQQHLLKPTPTPTPHFPCPCSNAVDTSKSRNHETDILVKEIYKSLYKDYAQKTSSTKSHVEPLPPIIEVSRTRQNSRSTLPIATLQEEQLKQNPLEKSSPLIKCQKLDEPTLSGCSEETNRDTESSTPVKLLTPKVWKSISTDNHRNKLKTDPLEKSPSRLAGRQAVDEPTLSGRSEEGSRDIDPAKTRRYTITDNHRKHTQRPQFLLEPQELTTPTETSICSSTDEDARNRKQTPGEETTGSIISDPSDVTVKPTEPEKKKKRGLFSTMLKLFTSSSRRRERTDSSNENYQTVYNKAQGHHEYGDRRRCTPFPRKEKSPPSSPHYERCPIIRQPGQQLLEKKTGNQSNGCPRYSAGGQLRFCEHPLDRPRRRPPFWQEYEARLALIPPARAASPDHRPQHQPMGRPASYGGVSHSKNERRGQVITDVRRIGCGSIELITKIGEKFQSKSLSGGSSAS